MSILSSQQPLDARTGEAQLLGQIRQLALQKPGVGTESGAGSFRAQLLQQVIDLCDRSSLAMNEPGVEALPLSTPWARMGAIRHQDLSDQPANRPAVRRGTLLAQASHVHHPAHHTAGPVLARPAPAGLPAPEPVALKSPVTAAVPAPSSADGFLEKLSGVARATAEALGLSPHLLLAQAALETGWGLKAIKDAAGQESHNLFGIKAGKHWTGKTVAVTTTEYIHGVPQKKVESFRAYDSFAESFADYARLIKHRYGEAMAQGATAEGFGRALQANGYATDPKYAQKIARVAQSVAYRLAQRPSGPSALA